MFRSERVELPTPRPATPEAVGCALQAVVGHFESERRVGIAFPAPIVDSIVLDSANISDQWIGMEGESFFEELLYRPIALINDADTAGLAESRWGAARGVDGLVLLRTLGTGIGSAILHDGRLITNTDLGVTPFRGADIEQYAAPSVMARDGIDEREWANRLNEVVGVFELMLRPDVIVVTGGITA